MAIQLQAHVDGTVLPVRARAGARADGLRGEHDGSLRVAVTQVAEKGKANKAILSTLSKELGIRRSALEVISGFSSPAKKILVRGYSVDELQVMLKNPLGS